jgi:hypothetical protein
MAGKLDGKIAFVTGAGITLAVEAGFTYKT